VEEPFAEMLEGGHRNSLGRAGEVVEIVLADRSRLDELFASLTEPDELVRLRAGDALEKVCRERPAWFVPHLERLLGEVGAIEQASANGTWPRSSSTSTLTSRTSRRSEPRSSCSGT
jgi:hypothetical protein